jgi:uncharacterized protein (TIRG00374 family)
MDAPRPDRSLKPIGLAALLTGLAISAVSLWLVARDVNGDLLQSAFDQADGTWISLTAILIIATILARTWRWAALLHPIGFPRPTILLALLSGQVLNFLLPARLGDVVRAALISRSGGTVERSLGTIVIEKAWDWLALTLLVVVVALLIPLPAWLIDPARAVGVVAVLVLSVLVIAALAPPAWQPRGLNWLNRVLSGLPPRLRAWSVERIRRLFSSLAALRDRSSLWIASVSSLLIWALGAATNYAVMRAYGVDSLPAALLLLAVLMVGVAVPPSIAALGVFEGLTMLTLSVFAVPAETALAIGVTLHLLIFLLPALGLSLLGASLR